MNPPADGARTPFDPLTRGQRSELLRGYLTYYRDLGITTLYRRENSAPPPAIAERMETASDSPAETRIETPVATHAAPPRPSVAAEAPPPLSGPSRAAQDLEEIRQDIGDCRRCRLHEGRNKIVFGVGDPETKLVFVGEGPGADEDAQGIPFVGRAGQLLTQMIENTAQREGIPLLRKDVYICNVVKCRPPQNRAPEPDEMEICGGFLFRQLAAINPKAICVLGATAAKAVLGRKEGVTRMRGNWYKWREIPVMVTYHPSYLLRPYNANAKREAWEDLKMVLHYVYD